MKNLIGLDVGTSSVKGVLMNSQGDILATVTKKHNYYTENQYKLLNADEFVDSCFNVIKELSSKSDVDIAAICTSGASGNVMLKGKENSAIYGWQNQFPKEIVDKYVGHYDANDFRNIVGWPKQYGFPLSALLYIKETEPEKLKNADVICMSMEYLNFKLTGKWGITSSMGTPFFLIDQEKKEYYQEFLDILGITAEQLPPIMPNCSVLGALTDDAAEKLGLSTETKVVLGTFDHPAAARGAGVFGEDDALLSCGTSWVVLVPFKTRQEPLEKKMLVDPFMLSDGLWCGMKSMASIAEKIDNARTKYFGEISHKEFDSMVPYKDGKPVEIDLDDPKELPEGVEKAAVARGIVVAAALKLKTMLDDLDIKAKEIKIVGGITNAKEWLEVISEVTGRKITVVNGECAGAAGSANMAGVGVGIFKSEMDLFIERQEKYVRLSNE